MVNMPDMFSIQQLEIQSVLSIKSLLLHWNCVINFYRHSVLLNKQALTVHKYFSANLQSCGCRLAIFVNEQNNKI